MEKKEEKKDFAKCSKCQTRMVKQSDTYVFPSFLQEPGGTVNFNLNNIITSRIYVCPKCHYMEFYYERPY